MSRTLWKFTILLELLFTITSIWVSISFFGSIFGEDDRLWGAWLCIITFAFLTYESWFGDVISKIILEACLCATITFVLVAVVIYYALDPMNWGLFPFFPVFFTVFYIVIFGLFTTGLLLRLRILLKMQPQKGPGFPVLLEGDVPSRLSIGGS